MNRKHYPSDISREQLERVSGALESIRHKTRPRQVDLYDIFCAILYLLKNSCVWRALPSDFPSVSTVRYYFDLWGKTLDDGGLSLLERALIKSGGKRAATQWTRQCGTLLYRERAKRQKCRHGAEESL